MQGNELYADLIASLAEGMHGEVAETLAPGVRLAARRGGE